MKMSERSSACDQTLLASQPSRNSHVRNVYSLIVRREISPRTKHVARWNWAKASRRKSASSSTPRSEGPTDARQGLLSWIEAESFCHLSATYCPLFPSPRSTIAAAYSPDGKFLASTHGDHTVKLIDCLTGNCLKVLVGHRRTPWVVSFHPVHREILASGSLDQEVRLWNTNNAECILSHQFYRPIASIAFHARGEILAVASGHKLTDSVPVQLYIWQYNKRGEASSPTLVLKTRRSLRAVHFHPLAAPFLLTAEVNDLDSSDPSMTQATSSGYLQYPPHLVFVANVKPGEHSVSNNLPLTPFPFTIMPSYSIHGQITQPRHSGSGSLSNMHDQSSTSMQFQTDRNPMEQSGSSVTTLEAHPGNPTDPRTGFDYTVGNSFSDGMGIFTDNIPVDNMVIDREQLPEEIQVENSTTIDIPNATSRGQPRHFPISENVTDFGHLHSRDNVSWELPFLQGWLIGQTRAGAQSMLPIATGSGDNITQPVSTSSSMAPNMYNHNVEAAIGSAVGPSYVIIPGGSGRSDLQNHIRNSHVSAMGLGHFATSSSILNAGSDIQAIVNRVQPEFAASVAAATPELPCTVKLRVWKYEINNPCAQLVADKCRLTISHAVLCSEMGTHFSPCGRYLAACVACMFPHIENDSGTHVSVFQDSGMATSPTRHPISAHRVMYELRIYSLEEASFGSVLSSRAIRAAHCLTSIQFSPTSEHILLAYGRRHGSLLKSIIIDGETIQPVYTVLEFYRVSDMELVKVLPSAEDEVNVACFHPFAGGGLVYGTKEGKLRVLKCNRGHVNCGTNHLHEGSFVVSANE